MKTLRWLSVVLVTVAALGCGRGSEGEGSVTILLTDGPSARLESAVVTISQIYLQPADEGERVILRDDPVTLDIASLANDTETLVDGSIVPDGDYSQLRFVIDGAYIVVVDDAAGRQVFATEGYATPGLAVDGSLQTPSWDTSGLKVKLADGGITVEGNQRILLVDFDLAESFGHPADDEWVMHPVLEALDLDLTATITVEVDGTTGLQLPAGVTLAEFRVRLLDAKGQFEGEQPLANQDDDPALEATFMYVDPREGPFSVVLVAPSGVTFQAEPAAAVIVSVDSGQSESVSFQIGAVSQQ